MSFLHKKKPGLLDRLFNSKSPQPASPAQPTEKVLTAEGDVLEGAEAGVKRTGAFSANRAARAVVADSVVEVEAVSDAASSPTSEDAPEPGAPAPAKSGLFARLKKPASTPAKPEGEVEEEGAGKPGKAAKKGLFGAKPKKNGGEKTAEPKAPKVSLPKKKKQGPKNSVAILADLGENGRKLIYTLTADSLTQQGDDTVPAEVLSFSHLDTRFVTEVGMSYAKASEMAIEEIGEMVAVVNCTKELRTVYSTQEERATASPYQITAGQQALDLLIKKRGFDGHACITGFELKDSKSPASVLVLYYMGADGSSSKPQVTVNPDNMEFVFSQFAASRKINRKETQLHIFTNEDLLSVVNELKPFANEKVWNGIPVRVLQNVGAGVAGVVAAGAVGWAATGFIQEQALRAEASKVQASTKAATDRNTQIIESSLLSFSDKLSIEQGDMFALAQKVWVPTSKVIAEAKPTETTLTIILPVNLGTSFNNGPSVNSVVSHEYVRQLHDLQAPEGCVKSQPQTTGNLNEIHIAIVCQSPTSAFHRYRGD